MTDEEVKWWPMNMAAEKFGYSVVGLRRRIRQLREMKLVVDLGRPPEDYKVSKRIDPNKVTVLWANPQTALISNASPARLFNSKRGRRAL
jgi:hypothetical protein